MESSNRFYISNNYPAFEVKIRNIKEENPNVDLYIPLQLHAAIKLFDKDDKSSYFSENRLSTSIFFYHNTCWLLSIFNRVCSSNINF